MKLAIIGDIHGNIYSLKSVIEDIKSRNIDTIISTGDLVGYLPFPNEVIETIRAKNIMCIQGNHDEFYGSSEPISKKDLTDLSTEEIQAKGSRIYTNYVLTDENRLYLKYLPKQLKLSFHNYSLIVVHGSPRKNNEYIYETTLLEEILDATQEDIIVCGHTHVPYHRINNNKHIINSGSAGKPKHGNANVTYVIIDINEEKVSSEIIEVKYDTEQLIEDIRSNDMIADKLIDNISKGY